MTSSVEQKKVLILHGGRFGQSETIATKVSEILTEAGVSNELHELSKQSAPDPVAHNAFVVVTSVRYGHFDRNAKRLVSQYLSWLDSVPTLLVTVSLTARSPEKRSPEVHSYTKKFLEKTQWAPTICEVVAGALQYSKYNWIDTKMIQLIMNISGGVTDTSEDVEYTDWDQVRDCAERFGRMVAAPK